MIRMKIKDICDLQNGRAFKPSDWGTAGLPIIRIQNLNDERAPFNYYGGKYNLAQEVDNGDLLFSWSGTPGTSFGAFLWNRGQGVLNQHIFKVIPKVEVDKTYLMYALNGNISTIISKAHGGVGLQHITKKELDEIEIQMVSISRQKEIVEILEKISLLIFLRKQQIVKLDELVKARFVEMFGDPADNVNNLPASPMTAICQIIDGDRGKNYPKQEEFSDSGFCLFLNAKNVTAQGFSFENCTYITEEKDALLRNGKLCRGDVVLTTRGTIGNLAFYDTSVPYENIRINSGMVILRMNKQVVSEIFFIEQFKMQLDSIKSRIASGSAQPQLPISTMNKIEMILPPIELQNQFSAFVERVDKQKQTVQQSLDKLELMKKALMQEYFG